MLIPAWPFVGLLHVFRGSSDHLGNRSCLLGDCPKIRGMLRGEIFTRRYQTHGKNVPIPGWSFSDAEACSSIEIAAALCVLHNSACRRGAHPFALRRGRINREFRSAYLYDTREETQAATGSKSRVISVCSIFDAASVDTRNLWVRLVLMVDAC